MTHWRADRMSEAEEIRRRFRGTESSRENRTLDAFREWVKTRTLDQWLMFGLGLIVGAIIG